MCLTRSPRVAPDTKSTGFLRRRFGEHVLVSMKRSTLMILIGVVLLGLALVVAASVLHDGLSARATPTRLEAFVARNARHLAIPGKARAAQNPVLDSAEGQRDAR